MGAAEFKVVLKKLRMEKGWTQKELSEKIGVSKTAVASLGLNGLIPMVFGLGVTLNVTPKKDPRGLPRGFLHN